MKYDYHCNKCFMIWPDENSFNLPYWMMVSCYQTWILCLLCKGHIQVLTYVNVYYLYPHRVGSVVSTIFKDKETEAQGSSYLLNEIQQISGWTWIWTKLPSFGYLIIQKIFLVYLKKISIANLIILAVCRVMFILPRVEWWDNP